MENKTNEATPLRPLGDRTLNAHLVDADLNKLIVQLKNESTWQENGRNSITLFKSEKLRIVLIGLHAEAELREHSTSAMLSVQVVSGKIHFRSETNNLPLESGQMVVLHENIAHYVLAEKESFFLLTLVK